MNPFNQYKNIIERALNTYTPTSINESYTGLRRAETRTFSYNEYKSKRNEIRLSEDLVSVAKLMKAKPFENQIIGHHPDFIQLKNTDNIENHYIISVFIDIKGSTNLFRKYDNETIMIITNAIQLSAISVCKLFGGFIHRLQGDGLFVYFGGKNVNKDLAVQHCLTALSLFTYFVKNDLKNLFEQQGIEKIYTKIGIDFGDDKDVLWGMAGVNNSSEITTCSLHTSLASKMQAHAQSNEIIVGDNIKKRVTTKDDLFSIISEEKRYIYRIPEKGFNYTQYKFDWYKFLKSLEHIAISINGNLEIRSRDPKPTIANNLTSLLGVASASKPWAV